MKVSPQIKSLLETLTYTMADRYIKDYNGGSWKWNKLGFWVPKMDKVEIHNCDNYYEGVMTPLCAGYAIGTLLLNRLVWKYYQINEPLARQFQAMYDDIKNDAFKTLSENEQLEYIRFID